MDFLTLLLVLFFIFLHGQVLGVITSTIGVAIAFKKFDALNDEMTHTKLGVAIMVLVWIQVLLSVIRPKRLADSAGDPPCFCGTNCEICKQTNCVCSSCQ
jgi:hypothetical protein